MTDEKILEVLALYEQRLQHAPHYHPELMHLREMLPKMRAFLAAGQREKVFRWLGFVQGVLYCFGLYTIDEMRDHNRDLSNRLAAES